MKAIRSLFKFHKRTTASSERPSTTRSETPITHHIGKEEPSDEQTGKQTSHVTSHGTPTIGGTTKVVLAESPSMISSEAASSRSMRKAGPSDRENGDRNQPSSVSGTPIIYNAAKVGIELMKEVSTVFGPLEGVVRGLTFILEHHEKWQANKQIINRLVSRIEALRIAFEKMGESQCNDKESQRRDALLRRLEDIALNIETITNKHKVSQYIAAGADEDALSTLVDDVRDALVDYQTVTQMEIDRRTAALMSADDDRLLLQLPRAIGASHLSEPHRSCLKGTRKDLLDELEAWAEDFNSRPIFWLNGHAGSGKSTLIQSFCQDAFSIGRLGASFFCSATSPDRSSRQMIFPTLAFQLARRFPAFRERLLENLRYRLDFAGVSLKTQFAELIVGPLENSGISTIIVIDALDECEESRESNVSTILSLLPEYIPRIPGVKFFVTARPEPLIRGAFRLSSLQSLTKVLVLGDVDESSVDHDIYLYLKTRLSESMKSRSDMDLPSLWPSDEDLRILTATCGQLFIFAATAVAFITSPYNDPVEQLAILKAMPEKNTGIDQLYRMVLLHGFPEVTDEYQVKWRLVIGSILLLRYPYSRNTLSLFLDIPLSTVVSMLRPLHAVLKIPETGAKIVTIYHKSFHDYMTDPARCTDPNFFVDCSAHHALLAKHCLRFINTHLREDSHPISYTSWLTLAGEHTEYHQLILTHSCRDWEYHFSNQFTDMQLISQVEEFLDNKIHLYIPFLERIPRPTAHWYLSFIANLFDRLYCYANGMHPDNPARYTLVSAINRADPALREFRKIQPRGWSLLRDDCGRLLLSPPSHLCE